MEVHTIEAKISYCMQLESGAWKKVELGAGAEITQDEDWDTAHTELYAALKTHLAAVWPVEERRPTPAPPLPAVPAPAAPATLCPSHGKAKSSRSGGLYCPAKEGPNGEYCKWTSEAALTKS